MPTHPDKYVASVSEWDRMAGCYTTRTEAVAPSLDDLILVLGSRIAPLGDGLLRLEKLIVNLGVVKQFEEQHRAAQVTAVLTK